MSLAEPEQRLADWQSCRNPLHSPPPLTKDLKISLQQTIIALSDSLDLVGVDEVFHGKRVAFIALQCGSYLGYEPLRLRLLFNLGLLHDCGVSSSQVHQKLISNFDWQESQQHCQIGYARLKNFPPLAHLAEPIFFHHTPWEELQKLELSPQLTRCANLIFLADRIDSLAAPHYGHNILFHTEQIRSLIKEKRGLYFDPQLVEAFLAVSASPAFWLAMESPHLTQFIQEAGQNRETVDLSFAELKQLAQIFSEIVDAKSSYTAEHSQGVARLASYLAGVYGFPAEICSKIEAAALLHDLGKLRIPDEILDKPTPLEPEDLTLIQQHSYDTYEILRKIPGIEDIANWAAFHHENLRGTGYPFRVQADQICMEARIIAVADIFQALAQNRPYREAMPLDDLLARLDGFVELGVIDNLLTALVKRNRERCFQEALLH